ncbi:g10844 [Coccomyxa elongata]
MGELDVVEDAHFVSKRPSRRFAQTTTVQHWQLRDLVHADGEHGVFFAQSNRTMRYDIKTGMSEAVQRLAFAPTAMTAGYGYLAAGGQNSSLHVMNIETEECLHWGPIGGSVINALHFGRDNRGQLRLFVSNNDRTVKIFDLPSMRLMSAITCPVAVNYAALSPDGSSLACVGDSGTTHIYRAAPTGFVEDYAFCEFRDCGIACAWNPSGTCIAAGSQDGYVVVWDARAHRRVVKLRTVAEGRVSGACRCIKFGEGPVDLMAFSEHSSHCHLIDSRAYHERQVLKVDACEGVCTVEEGACNVSGLSFTPSGRRLYVGLEGTPEHGIMAFDVQMLSRLTFGSAQYN